MGRAKRQWGRRDKQKREVERENMDREEKKRKWWG